METYKAEDVLQAVRATIMFGEDVAMVAHDQMPVLVVHGDGRIRLSTGSGNIVLLSPGACRILAAAYEGMEDGCAYASRMWGGITDFTEPAEGVA